MTSRFRPTSSLANAGNRSIFELATRRAATNRLDHARNDAAILHDLGNGRQAVPAATRRFLGTTDERVVAELRTRTASRLNRNAGSEGVCGDRGGQWSLKPPPRRGSAAPGLRSMRRCHLRPISSPPTPICWGPRAGSRPRFAGSPSRSRSAPSHNLDCELDIEATRGA